MKPASYKIDCPYKDCGQHIEFPSELLNTKTQCPNCNRSVWLSLDAAKPAGAIEVASKTSLMPWIVAGGALLLCAVFAFVAYKAVSRKPVEAQAAKQEQAPTSQISAQPAQGKISASSTANESTIKIVTIKGMSYNEGKTKQFPYTVTWTEYQLPKTPEVKSACKDIVSELKQFSKVLELGITYDRFSDLLQEKTLAIEKIKDKTEGIPSQFLKHVDDCISFYKISRDNWKMEVESTDDPNGKASAAFERLDCWSLAKVQELYCVGIVNNNLAVSDAIMLEMAAETHSDETIVIPHNLVREKKLGLDTSNSIFPHPVVSKMTAEQILAQFRSMAAASASN